MDAEGWITHDGSDRLPVDVGTFVECRHSVSSGIFRYDATTNVRGCIAYRIFDVRKPATPIKGMPTEDGAYATITRCGDFRIGFVSGYKYVAACGDVHLQWDRQECQNQLFYPIILPIPQPTPQVSDEVRKERERIKKLLKSLPMASWSNAVEGLEAKIDSGETA